MTDDVKIEPTEPTEPMTATDYVANINKLKASTVSKDEYNALLKEKNTLAEAILTNQSVDTTAKPVEKPDINKLRNDLFNPDHDLSNLENAQRTLALRDALIANGERDPFLPNGHEYVENETDSKAAQKVADAFKYCIDNCNGDSGVFTSLLASITVDTAPVNKQSRR